jgi:cell fate regulator YaaT (PSP1 superfamily)
MSIFPLPVFEDDADPSRRSAMTDAEAYARLEPPKTIVIRFGSMQMVGEYPHGGDAKPGCGSKLVARTHRGTELGEMLTTTCENAGCGKSVTRKELLEYIEQSGGSDYPFHEEGQILRVATVEDLQAHDRLKERGRELVPAVRRRVDELELDLKLVEIEPILGGETLTVHYTAPERVDFRELVRLLAGDLQTRVVMHQVGARDEARLLADYERCGQYCCCKNFLKVLKPVSMGSAKMQKATLDPLKISGRCGRLMCCLRYEDETYRDLKKRLPHRRSRVGTTEGPGHVVDSRTLVQLVLVKLEHDGREIAVPVEELLDPETCPRPGDETARAEAEAKIDPLRGAGDGAVRDRATKGDTPPERRARRRRGRSRSDSAAADGGGADAADAGRDAGAGSGAGSEAGAGTRPPETGDPAAPGEAGEAGTSGRRRRRRRGRSGGGGESAGGGSGEGSGSRAKSGRDGTEPGPPKKTDGGEGEGPRRRRRRRGRGRRGGGGGGGGGSGGGPVG